MNLKYINAKTILPDWLIEKLQEYAQGELLYIPGKEDERAKWGEANGTREKYMQRNSEIVKRYQKGTSVIELAGTYHLSEYSIRKIISNSRPHKADAENKDGCYA